MAELFWGNRGRGTVRGLVGEQRSDGPGRFGEEGLDVGFSASWSTVGSD